MITDEAKKKVAIFLREMFGTNGDGAGTIKLGTGGGGTNPTATDLDVPLSTTSGTTASSSDDKVIEFSGSFSGGNLQGYTIREMGLFGNLPSDAEMATIDSSGYGPTLNDAVMLSRVNFEPIGNFSTNDTIDIIYTMEVE
tara:strand:- start:818 stop:1237 length:420 start_codon:yes stop_codon:yes gene_type:complete